VIKPDKFRPILGIRAEIDDYHFATLQLREPVDAPSQHFNLSGDSGLHRGRGCRVSCGHFTVGWVVAHTQVRQPRRNLAGFGILEQLMDAAVAQASRGGDLPDGETGVRRGDDGPDTPCSASCKRVVAMHRRFWVCCSRWKHWRCSSRVSMHRGYLFMVQVSSKQDQKTQSIGDRRGRSMVCW
jgi:hypothetical protein